MKTKHALIFRLSNRIVQVIFTDKTGTLTSNEMNYRQSVIGVELYETVDTSKARPWDGQTYPLA